jgi:Na+/melibiose symporter-like transporter
METKTGLTKNLKRFFGIGDMFFVLMSNVQDTFFNFFLTNIAMFDLGLTTFITTITTIIDASLSWIYGAIMSGTKPLKWGRYRSWLLITPWLVPPIYMLKFAVIGNKATAVIIIIAAGAISSIIWNFGYVANMAIIPIVGRTPEDRAHLSATRGTFNRVGSMLFSYMGLPFANILAGIVTEQYKFAALAFVMAVLAAIGYNIHFKLTEGYEPLADLTEHADEKQAANAPKTEKASISAMAKSLFKNGPLISLIVAEFTRWVANFVLMGCSIYYFQYIALNTSLMATYILAVNIVCMAGAFVSKNIAAKLGNKPTFFMSFLLFGACLVIGRMFYTSPWIVIALIAIGQFGYGCIYSLSPAMFSDASIYAEYKTGENASGWIMGLGNLPLKVGLVMRSVIINGVLAAVGFSAAIAVEATTDAVKAGIANAFMLIPGAMLLVGALLIIFGFRLSKEQIIAMSEEIAKR